VPGDAGEPVDRIRLFAATRAALVTEPTVWLIEDLHWADAPTLDLIRYLARRGDAGPVLLLLTFRDDEVGVGHPVRVLLGELATVRGVRRVGVPPLSRAAVADLARGSGVDVDALCDRTGGNPFFVTEVLASAQETVPPTVRDAVLARAARLSDAAFAVLAAAAVIGSHPEIDVLAAVADQPLTALDECLAAGMLVDGGGQVMFRHELAREAIASGVLPGRRQALHRAAYDALRAAGNEDDRRLAQHAAGAGDGRNVIVHAPGRRPARPPSARTGRRPSTTARRCGGAISWSSPRGPTCWSGCPTSAT
jgi:predicted ATPase